MGDSSENKIKIPYIIFYYVTKGKKINVDISTKKGGKCERNMAKHKYKRI
jgi:hypothetical protein